MYVVIAGAGLFGLTLAQQLVGHRYDVQVIDPDPDSCAYARLEIGCMACQGNAMSMKVLEGIGMRRADVAVGMMRQDSDNLSFLLLAQHFGVPRRLARVREPEFAEPYRLAGATAVADSVEPVIRQMMTAIEFPTINRLMPIGKGNMDVFELDVPANAAVAGWDVRTIANHPRFPSGCNFVAVQSPDGNYEVARGDTVIRAGGKVVMFAFANDVQAAVDLLAATQLA